MPITTSSHNSNQLDIRNDDSLGVVKPHKKIPKENNQRRRLSSHASSNAEHKGKYFSIQVAAFIHEKQAISLLQKMKQEGFDDVRIKRGVRYYHVRTGYSKNKDSLYHQNEKIQKSFKLKTLIVQETS